MGNDDKTSFQHYSLDLDQADTGYKSRRELVRLHRKGIEGDSEAWHTLWLYGTKLVLKLCNKLRNENLLSMAFEDAVAEGNLAIGEALDKWNPKLSAFSTWVWIRVRSAVLYENQKDMKNYMVGPVENSPLTVSENTFHTDEYGNPLSLVDWSEDGVTEDITYQSITEQQLRERVDALPGKEREYIQRVYFDGQTQAEIAALEGISQSMVSRIMQRGFARLHRYYNYFG